MNRTLRFAIAIAAVVVAAGFAACGDDEGTVSGEETETSTFVPKYHNDSGGGAEQFRGKNLNDAGVLSHAYEASSSEFEEAAAAMHAYFDARAAGEWEAACLYMGATAVDLLAQVAEIKGTGSKGEGCPGLLETVSTPESSRVLRTEANAADAGAFLLSSESLGYLFYHGAEDTLRMMVMQDEGEGWRVAATGGSVL